MAREPAGIFTVSAITMFARWLKMDAEKAGVPWLDRNAEQ